MGGMEPNDLLCSRTRGRRLPSLDAHGGKTPGRSSDDGGISQKEYLVDSRTWAWTTPWMQM